MTDESGTICRRLTGRTAVITGAGSGIGLATARRLASEGAHVVCGDIDESAGRAAAEEAGGTFVRVDVTDPGQVEALFATAHETYGSVDIAVNNAGISPPEDDSILTTGLEAWKRVQDVNLTSVYLCCKAAVPYMRRQGRGSIINTASFVARMGAATSQISYTASKGGVLALSRELGVQFAREGIRVNALCPGPVNTPCSGSCSPRIRSAPPAGSCTSPRPVRRGDGDRGRGRLPGERRLLVRQRHRLPRRRRDLGGVRHTARLTLTGAVRAGRPTTDAGPAVPSAPATVRTAPSPLDGALQEGVALTAVRRDGDGDPVALDQPQFVEAFAQLTGLGVPEPHLVADQQVVRRSTEQRCLHLPGPSCGS